tara:strand:+ start:61 stop:198 length:138 start_codon:yes stop_codon:yes gene_type:complete
MAIMKKQRKIRSAKILFTKDSPFKMRVIRNKKKFTRKIKHRRKNG